VQQKKKFSAQRVIKSIGKLCLVGFLALGLNLNTKMP